MALDYAFTQTIRLKFSEEFPVTEKESKGFPKKLSIIRRQQNVKGLEKKRVIE